MDKVMWDKAQEIVGNVLRNNDFLNDGLGDFLEYNVEKTDKVAAHSIYFNGTELRVELMQDSITHSRYVVGYAQWVNEVFLWGGAYAVDTASDNAPWDEVIYEEATMLARYALTVVQCAAYRHPLTPAPFATGTRCVTPTSRYSVYRALHERMKYELNREYEQA